MTLADAGQLRDSLHRRGFSLAVADGMLYVAPRAELTEEDARQIKECKPFLLRLLTTPDDFSQRLRAHLKTSSVPVSDSLLEALEQERIMPELDEYGVRLSMKMSGALYVMTANARREAFLATKAGRKKPINTEEE